MTTVEVLRAAREKLAKPGVWAKGFALSDDRLCAAHAIAWAARWENKPCIGEALRALVVATKQPNVSGAVVLWNDAPERTLEEVLAAFDRAIALAEAQ